MRQRFLFLSILAAMSILAAQAQSPSPIIVQAASPATAQPGAPVSTVQNSDAVQAAIKMLQEMKTANEDMLKKQEATLQQLDEVQKAADQIKIFSKRS
jgi:hypothetical protein